MEALIIVFLICLLPFIRVMRLNRELRKTEARVKLLDAAHEIDQILLSGEVPGTEYLHLVMSAASSISYGDKFPSVDEIRRIDFNSPEFEQYNKSIEDDLSRKRPEVRQALNNFMAAYFSAFCRIRYWQFCRVTGEALASRLSKKKQPPVDDKTVFAGGMKTIKFPGAPLAAA
ncbi:hypothetical protein [Cerasicoccus maritimus]|uniref:hypothetical protein n=1 Tax=Cerasicoccus maritimus TaxID=490089 RepID=UPI0028527772|nr:hypothetical protein [Cerasicoccus maritimus]